MTGGHYAGVFVGSVSHGNTLIISGGGGAGSLHRIEFGDKVALTVVMVVVVVMVVLDHQDRHLSVVVAEHHLAVVPVVLVMKDLAEAVAHCKAVLTRNQTLVDLVLRWRRRILWRWRRRFRC